MQDRLAGRQPAAKTIRRVLPAVVAVLATAVVCAPAWATPR